MAIFLEFLELNKDFPFQTLFNSGDILTTPHWHKEIEIIFITKGDVYLGVNDQHYTMTKDEAIIINGGEIHYVLASPESERIVFQFDSSFFGDISISEDELIIPGKIFKSVEPYSSNWDEQVSDILISLLKEIYEEDKVKPLGYRYCIKSKLYQFLIILIRDFKHYNRNLPKQSEVQSNEILEKLGSIFRYIEDNYSQPIKLDDAANTINYSPYYFTKFFKKNTGKTFITFLNEYRIDKAKWILINEEETTITQITARVGLNNKTFYRLFKEQVGIPPLEYRKLIVR